MHLSPDSDLTGKPNSSKSPFLAAAWLFLLGVALTLLLFKLASDAEHDSLRQKLHIETVREAADLQDALDYSIRAVDSLRRLYESSDEVIPIPLIIVSMLPSYVGTMTSRLLRLI